MDLDMDETLTMSDRIADVVLAQFDSLPSKCKPLIDNNGNKGWTVLSGIVIEKGMKNQSQGCLAAELLNRRLLRKPQCNLLGSDLTCVSLAYVFMIVKIRIPNQF